jgi:hypothetical protein
MVFGGLFLVSPAAAEDDPGQNPVTEQVDAAVVESPETETATITVTKGGVRQSGGAIGGLAGATFTATPVAGAPLGVAGDFCVTPADPGSSGTCDIEVTLPLNTAWSFTVTETPPTGWGTIGSMFLDDKSETYMPVTVEVEGGETVDLPTRSQGGEFVANRAANPPWSKFCGMKVALVFDQSGSIELTEWNAMLLAAEGFVEALRGTPSSISMFSFASRAPGMFTHSPMPVRTDGEADAAIDIIRKLPFRAPDDDSATNWDEGLWQVVTSKQDLDAVLMLTDGNPTVNRGSQGSGGTVNVQDVTEAVFSANAVKAMGETPDDHPRLVGVGIGLSDAVVGPRQNLAAITGDNTGEYPDYYLTSFTGLDDVLKSIAAEQCAGTITVTKYVGDTMETATPQNDWPFTAEIAPVGEQPNGTVTPAAGVTATVTKGEEEFVGLLQFQLALNDGVWPKTVTITEGIAPVEDASIVSATCTINPGVVGTTNARQLEFVNVGSAVKIEGIQEKDSVSCDFLNKITTTTPPCVDCGGGGGGGGGGTTPTTPPKTPTPTVVEAPAVAAPAEMVEAVAVAQPATVPEAEAPAEVAVPAAATVPESVPAGDGSQGPAVPVWITALLMASLLGVAVAGAMRLGGRRG